MARARSPITSPWQNEIEPMPSAHHHNCFSTDALVAHGCRYASMAGMKKSYLFMALDAGIVAMRTFACWCPACMQAIGRGEGSLDSSLCCAGCVSPHLKWQERSAARTDANGLANARMRAQVHARKLAGQLEHALQTNARVLVAVQNRGEDDEDQYWLGWAKGVVERHTSSGTVPGTRTRYDAGDLEVEVEWMQRDVSGGDERRTFRVWAATAGEGGAEADPGPLAGKTYTFNSTELRGAVGLVLEPVAPVGGAPLGVVARVRRQAAVAGDAARRALPGVAQAVHDVMALAPRELWTISSADENVILSHCW